MISYIIRRLLLGALTLVLAAVIVFFLIHMTPGDPISTLIGPMASMEQIEQIRSSWGLDKPVYMRFFIWFGQMLKGNFGVSYSSGKSVGGLLASKAKVTFILTACAVLVGTIFGLFLGTISAIYRNTFIDRISVFFAIIGVSIPKFWFGYLLVYLFALILGWLPSQGYVSPFLNFPGWIYHAILPILALSLAPAARIARMTRSSVLEVFQEDYVNTARAKGLNETKVVGKHVLRNALIPVVTIIGLTVAIMMAGVVTIELVFSIPGMGQMLITALGRRDYPVIQAIVLWIAFAFISLNLIVDLTYAWLDPRVTYD